MSVSLSLSNVTHKLKELFLWNMQEKWWKCKGRNQCMLPQIQNTSLKNEWCCIDIEHLGAYELSDYTQNTPNTKHNMMTIHLIMTKTSLYQSDSRQKPSEGVLECRLLGYYHRSFGAPGPIRLLSAEAEGKMHTSDSLLYSLSTSSVLMCWGRRLL